MDRSFKFLSGRERVKFFTSQEFALHLICRNSMIADLQRLLLRSGESINQARQHVGQRGDAWMPRYVSLDEAADLLSKVPRVLVVGCSGGGKTTFSGKIAAFRHLEFQSLDRDVRWLPGWIERDRAEQRDIIKQLVQRDRWVMDGSGASSFDIRLPRTELVLWFECLDASLYLAC